MKYEVIEETGAWVVRRDGVELARFVDQLEALSEVAERLREADGDSGSYSLAMRYQAPR